MNPNVDSGRTLSIKGTDVYGVAYGIRFDSVPVPQATTRMP